MISQLTGTLVEVLPTHVVMDVGGIGFLLGVSANTAAQLPSAGSSGVTLQTRLLVKEGSLELYGFSSGEERAVFDRLVAVSGVGPKLALAVLSTFTPAALATTVTLQDAGRMAQVPGVGKKKAQRLIVELQDVFTKDAALRGLVGPSEPGQTVGAARPCETRESVIQEAGSALLSLGFSPQEVELALKGYDDEDAGTRGVEAAVSFALRRLGGGA